MFACVCACVCVRARARVCDVCGLICVCRYVCQMYVHEFAHAGSRKNTEAPFEVTAMIMATHTPTAYNDSNSSRQKHLMSSCPNGTK